jgi:hypothetical protein
MPSAEVDGWCEGIHRKYERALVKIRHPKSTSAAAMDLFPADKP